MVSTQFLQHALRNGLCTLVLFLSVAFTAHAASDYDTVFANILNNSSNSASQQCTACHDGMDTNDCGAPGDFADYTFAAPRAALVHTRTSAGEMPLNPADCADFSPSNTRNLDATDLLLIANWRDAGAPQGPTTASNRTIVTKTNTTATLRGTVNTNVHAATSVAGKYKFEYGVDGDGFSLGPTSLVDQSDTANFNTSANITNLVCETTYEYAAYSQNGSDTTTATASTFKTNNCAAPIIRRDTTNAGTTESYTVGKGSSLTNAADFDLNATDVDGTAGITWSLSGGQPAAGSVTVTGTGSTPTITYTAPANVPTPDTVTFNVLASDNSNDGARTDIVTISIQIVDSPPTITNATQPENITVNEDDGNGESVTLTAMDVDLDPLMWSVVGGTEPANGTLNTFSTGNSQIVTYTPNGDIDTDESFSVRVSDGTGSAVIVINVDVVPQPDNPIAVADPNFIVLVNSMNNTLDVLFNDSDIDTIDTKTLAAQVIVGSNGGTITVNNAGTPNNDLSYTPATNATVVETFTYTVTDSFGLTDTALVTVTPPDTDADGVFDFIDNCAATPNGPLGGPDNQLDNDNDQLINVNTTSDPADPLVGGDACDTDDDNDGMSDVDELQFPDCLDPFNAADATEDCDGDGIDNITEVNDGDPNTTPDEDSVAPTVTAPADVNIDATGLLTNVALGSATATDGNDGESTLFKVGVNLDAAALALIDDAVTGCDELTKYKTDAAPFRPGAHTVTWITCDSAGNTARDNQSVNVKPLLSVSSGQFVGEGQTVNVEAVLNGDATAYPASVSYTITGTAVTGDDHDGTFGTISFNAPGDTAIISFNTLDDGITEDDETAVVTLHSPVGAVLNSAKVHTVTITGSNVPPMATLNITQPAAAAAEQVKGFTIYQVEGVVNVVVSANDGNGDTLSFDWSATEESLRSAPSTIITDNQITFDPNELTTGGFYKLSVAVSDGTTSVSLARLLLIKTTEDTTGWAVGDDDDGDGIDNLDEGYGDDDADGIPNYLDNNSTPPNAIENHTVNLESSLLIETDPGLHISMGETAIASQVSGVLVGLQDIIDNGGGSGAAATNADTDYTFLSGLSSFEITGLNDTIESVNVVIPLTSAIQADVVYRKYNSSGWFDFFVDDKNELRSAIGAEGVCPPPGSVLYAVGLNAGHLCLQLTIQDGGTNDADGVRNYIVIDPGGLALAPEPENVVVDDPAAKANGRVGTMNLWFMLIICLGYVTLIKRLKIRS